jgi:hypothetical protein
VTEIVTPGVVGKRDQLLIALLAGAVGLARKLLFTARALFSRGFKFPTPQQELK